MLPMKILQTRHLEIASHKYCILGCCSSTLRADYTYNYANNFAQAATTKTGMPLQQNV